MKDELKKLSPKRFELWEHMLRTSKALPILHLDAELNRHAEVREKMEPKIKEVRETVKGLQNSIAK